MKSFGTSDGLAVLGTIDMFKISLPVAIEELTVVSNSFHTKPLRRYLQSVERYNVLGLSLHDYQIYEGNRHSLIELKLPQILRKYNDALGYDLTDKHTTVASYGGVGSQTGGMHHGHGGKSPEEDIDTEKFFFASQKRLMITIPVHLAYHLWLHCQSTRIFS
jgi:hypothetical protein